MWKYIQIVSLLLFSNSEALSTSDYSYAGYKQPIEYDQDLTASNFNSTQSYDNGVELSSQDGAVEDCDDDEDATELHDRRSLRARRRKSRPAKRRTSRPRKRVTRKRVVKRRRVVRSAYFRPPIVRRRIKRRVVVRRRAVVVRRPKRVIVVRRKVYSPRVTRRRVVVIKNLQSRCRSYGYYNRQCITKYPLTYRTNYWDKSMFSLCQTSGYYNTRCIGRVGYRGTAVRVRRGVVVVRSGSGGLIGGLVGLCIFCCIIGVVCSFVLRGRGDSGGTVHIIDEGHDEVIVVEEEYYEEDAGGAVFVMGDTAGHHYDDYGHEEVHVVQEYGHEGY